MKLILFLIPHYFVLSNCKSNYFTIAQNVTNCPVFLPVQTKSQTIFFDLDPDSDPEIKSCILKNSHSDQSVIVLSTHGRTFTNLSSTKFYRTSDVPNFVIYTHTLISTLFDNYSFRINLKSHWSLVYIVVTSLTNFKCNKDGVMSNDDFKRLEYVMNMFWHKYRLMQVALAFPFTCKHKMVIYNGKRPSHTLYDRPIKLIDVTNSTDLFRTIKKSGDKRLTEHYPFRANIFLRDPTSITDCKKLRYYRNRFNLNLTSGYCGLDGLVMHDVLLYFKFNLTFPDLKKCNDFGYGFGENITGSLGCIVRNELDISFNSRFMMLYTNKTVYYLHFIATDSLCALLKKTGVIPVWYGVFNVYTTHLWLLIASVLVLIGIVMWATAKITATMTRDKTKTFWFYLHDAVVSTMFGSSMRKDGKFRILRGTSLFGAILFGALYQGHINHVYTTLQRFQRIETLEQLYMSGTTLYTSPSMKEIVRLLSNPDDKLQAEFYEQIRLLPYQGGRLDFLLNHPKATTLDRKSDVMVQIYRRYLDAYGRPKIDIVDECLITYYLSYITRSGFPFFEYLQRFMERLREAGLPTIYYRWTQRMFGIPDVLPRYHSEPRPFSKITLDDQRIAFIIIIAGHIGSTVIFIAEMWWAKRRGQNCRVQASIST